MSDLTQFLKTSGYQQVQLNLNGVGHFQTPATLGNQPLRALIDTGASVTVLHLEVARRLGLSLNKLAHKGGGAGGVELEVFAATEPPELRLGSVGLRPKALLAMDLSHVNQGLHLKASEGVDVIIGVDVFENQAAVIDYKSKSLFLKA